MTFLTAYRCRKLIIIDLCFVTSPESVFLSRAAPLTQPEDLTIDIGTVIKEKLSQVERQTF